MATQRRLSSSAIRIGMLGVLSLAVASCGDPAADPTPVAEATTSTPSPEPTTSPDEDDDEVTAYCVERPDGSTTTSSTPPPDGYRVVDDEKCDDDDVGKRPSSRASYFWYYGGTQNSRGHVRGGTLRPPGKAIGIVTKSGQTLRSGFGSGAGKNGSGGG